jgi:hypothetical protein
VSWKQWLAKGDIKGHQTSKQELDNLRALIARDLADAAIVGLSADRRFATAYNAALQSGTIAIACSGYRVSARAGHHKITFEAAALALGSEAVALADYFDACRRKRNGAERAWYGQLLAPVRETSATLNALHLRT